MFTSFWRRHSRIHQNTQAALRKNREVCVSIEGRKCFLTFEVCAQHSFFFRSFCMLSCQKFKLKPLREHSPRNLQFCITCTKKLLLVLFVSHASRFVYSPAWDNHGHGIATFFCHEIFGVGSPALASIFPKVYAKNAFWCDLLFTWIYRKNPCRSSIDLEF